ncbi:Cytochrome c2 [compost metagenome]
MKVSADGLRARLIVDHLRQYYIHTITVEGVRSQENFYSLIHPIAYYTLNSIPNGEKLSMNGVSTRNSANAPVVNVTPGKSTTKKSTAAAKTTVTKKVVEVAAKTAVAPSYAQVKGLLASYTCTACHNPTKKQIGPSFMDIAKRKYSPEKMLSLIRNPQPQNWPGYATEMPPMPQVTKEDGIKIANWINSLNK